MPLTQKESTPVFGQRKRERNQFSILSVRPSICLFVRSSVRPPDFEKYTKCIVGIHPSSSHTEADFISAKLPSQPTNPKTIQQTNQPPLLLVVTNYPYHPPCLGEGKVLIGEGLVEFSAKPPITRPVQCRLIIQPIPQPTTQRRLTPCHPVTLPSCLSDGLIL